MIPATMAIDMERKRMGTPNPRAKRNFALNVAAVATQICIEKVERADYKPETQV